MDGVKDDVDDGEMEEEENIGELSGEW